MHNSFATKDNRINSTFPAAIGFLTLLAVLVLFLQLSAPSTVKAATISDGDISLYVGNTYQLDYSIDANSYWNYFESSDSNIVTVDDEGKLTAKSKGTATITLVDYCTNPVTITVTVKNNGAKISTEEITTYVGQTNTVMLSWSNKTITGYDYAAYVDYYGNGYLYKTYNLTIENYNNGQFDITADSAGEYVVDLILYQNGNSFSRRCIIHVKECGLNVYGIAVATGSTIEIPLKNAELISVSTNYYGYSETPDCVAINYNNSLTGVSVGSTYIDVTFRTPYGETKTQTLTVYCTDPQYTAPEGPLNRNDYSYSPNISGTSYYSDVTITSSNEKVATVESGYYSDYLYLEGFGTTILTINVDGRIFTQEITVINPKLSTESVLLKPKKTKKLKVTGILEGTKITYKSSNKKIATVTSGGKITAKKAGSCYITVKVGNYEMICTVNVASGTAYTVITKGVAVIGSKYSTDNRMKTGYYDCSSFAWRTFNEAGIKLGGLTYAPSAADLGKKVEATGCVIAYDWIDPDKLLPGDLIFYSGKSDRYRGIGHVAIYYGADYRNYYYDGVTNVGKIIHAAPSVDGVNFSNYSSYQEDMVVMICRPLK